METVKGFRDYTGEEAEKKEKIIQIIKEVFSKYNFEPAETPIIEYESFVKGENTNDEAVSDIFKLKDKGERELALRYEFTFQLKRIAQNKKLPYKRYSVGPVFRDEPVSGNRLRQFYQADVDIISSTLKDDAEILSLASEVMKNLNIDYEIFINNRKLLNEILSKENIKEENFTEIIRIIDKLDKKSEAEVKNELKKFKAEKIVDIFKNKETYFKKYAAYSEIEELKRYCAYFNVKVSFLPTLARGLSYYTGTIFEIKTKEIKETITGGGSYQISGLQSTGISFGVDRLLSISKIDTSKKSFLIISLGEDEKAISLSQEIRKSNAAEIFYGKPSKALEYANSKKISHVIFLGENEVKNKKVMIKDMNTGKEKAVEIKNIEKFIQST